MTSLPKISHPRGARVTLISGAVGVVVGTPGSRVNDAGDRIPMCRVIWPLGSAEFDATFDRGGKSWHDADALDALPLAVSA